MMPLPPLCGGRVLKSSLKEIEIPECRRAVLLRSMKGEGSGEKLMSGGQQPIAGRGANPYREPPSQVAICFRDKK